MAETFEAVRSGPNDFEQRVCIKLVLPFFQQNQDFIELFHREAKLAAKLRHSNIVGVIDFGQIDGKSYIALELVDGCDLRNLLDARDRTRLSPEQVALIGLDLAAALDHAHNPDSREATGGSGSVPQPIVHRDISPSNVLISRLGEVMLTDFGVAKAITGTARKQSAIKGKIPYMSPEQLRGEAVDGRSDLFALGVVLFEALSGQRPYEGPSDPATILLTLKGEHPSLGTLAPNAPPKLCDIIESLLEPELEKRPQTATELTELLDEFTPPRRTRRELGAMARETTAAPGPLVPDVPSAVAETKRDPSAPPASKVETGVGLKERRAPDEKEATAPPVEAALLGEPKQRGSRRRTLAMLVGTVVAIGGAVGVGLLWPSEPPDDAPSEAAAATASEARETPMVELDPTASDEEAVVEVESGPEPEPLEEAPKKDAPAEATHQERRPRAKPATPSPAHLTVIAVPWGSVWIDGKRVGSSPLKNQPMKPGRYVVGAGQASPTKTQTIRLRPGQRKTVKFDLIE
jgi:serine/threonine protein kinase